MSKVFPRKKFDPKSEPKPFRLKKMNIHCYFETKNADGKVESE